MIKKIVSLLRGGGRLTEFSVLSAIVIGLIGLFLSQILHRTIEQQELDRAVNEMQVLVDLDLIKNIDRDEITNGLSSDRIRGIQSNLRSGFATRNVHELVLVNDRGEIIFASDTASIGNTIEWTDAWSSALNGTPVTEIVEVSGDASVAPIIRRYGTVVRIYQPVRLSGSDLDEKPTVLRTSVPHGPIAARISEVTRGLYAVLTLSLIVLYAVLLRVMFRAVKQITQLQTSLLQAQKLKAIGNVAGGVAHDFNNLLAVISSNLELLGQKNSDPATRNHVTDALRAVNLGSRLTHQLLAFCRQQPLVPENLNIANMIRQSESLIKTAIGDQIDLELRIDPQSWNARVDSVQLQMAVMNIAINARDAMSSAGTLTIDVSNSNDVPDTGASGTSKSGEFVRITITDTGVGMTPEMIENALEPFFSTKEVGRGTGLGLPMAYGFAEQSGGYMRISSEPGKGTSIELYLLRTTEAEAKPENNPKKVAAAHRSNLEGCSVFLVEDDDSLRQAVIMMLESIGCTVHSARDGWAALAMLNDTPHVDYILSDVRLPDGMEGPTVAAKVLARFPVADVVLMSGDATEANIFELEIGKPVILLQKPFKINELFDALAG